MSNNANVQQTKAQVNDAANKAANKAEKAVNEAGEKAEHFYDEAKATAEKVGEFISKEAEELGDHAKEARKSLCASFQSGLKSFQNHWQEFSGNPKYWLPVLSIANAAVLGAVGYFGYHNRHEIERWDRRVLSAIVAGSAAFFGLEGYLVTKNTKKQLK